MLSKLGVGNNEINYCSMKVQAFGGFVLSVKGKVKLKCEIDGTIEEVEFVVIDNKYIKSILGRDTCEKLMLIQKINVIVSQNEKEQFIKDNKRIFEGLGKLPFKHKITLKENVTPVVRPPRRIPFKIKEKLKNTLETLEKNKIIEKIDKPTEWVNNLVITEKKNGTLKICLDPKFLNQANVENIHIFLPEMILKVS
ncbi:unnamed protein product [Macrosiphum euphorbiae]|uniref:Uncharacterized protein n=1 Tax=Macrosiphum euphorbiae TaxID=13131 RepID=A0AAV0Y2W3_9HEMI|nr:unnamed protein product [Macrosiphum euphorbiae]